MEGAVRASQRLRVPNTRHEKEESIHSFDASSENPGKPRATGTSIIKGSNSRVGIGTDRVRDRGYPDADDVGVGARKRPNGSRKVGNRVNRPGPDKHRDF